MVQFSNFIPRTKEDCRRRLLELRDNPDGIRLTDNYGHTETLTAEQVKELSGHIERQIGEKTPAAPEPEKETSPEETKATDKKKAKK